MIDGYDLLTRLGFRNYDAWLQAQERAASRTLPEPVDNSHVSAVSADQAMPIKKPQIPLPTDRRNAFVDCRNRIGCGIGVCQREQGVEFTLVKTDTRQIQIRNEFKKLAQLRRQQFPIPAGLLGKTVVRDDIGAADSLSKCALTVAHSVGESACMINAAPWSWMSVVRTFGTDRSVD